VAGKSPKYQWASSSPPALTVPGQYAIAGTRMPPSSRSRLMRRRGAVGVEEVGLVPALLVRPVVGGEGHQRVAVDAQFLEQIQDASDVAVDPADGGGEGLLGLGPVLVGERPEIGDHHPADAGLVVGVRKVQGEVQEERLAAVFADEPQGVVGQQVGRVVPAFVGDALAALRELGVLPLPPRLGGGVAEGRRAAVADEELRPAVVGVPHVRVAVEVVEAQVVGVGEVVRRADAPLADAGGRVPGALEHRRQVGPCQSHVPLPVPPGGVRLYGSPPHRGHSFRLPTADSLRQPPPSCRLTSSSARPSSRPP
jgi:hypothetical protein